MAGILQGSHRDLKKTMINMLKTLMYKVDRAQGQMDNISREMQILKKEPKTRKQK